MFLYRARTNKMTMKKAHIETDTPTHMSSLITVVLQQILYFGGEALKGIVHLKISPMRHSLFHGFRFW